MSKIYFVRHQAAGIITKYPFSQSPSDEQIAAIKRECQAAHGELHPKEDEDGNRAPYWTQVIDFDVLGPSDVPTFNQPASDVFNAAGVPEFSVTGSVSVTKGGE